MIMINLIKQVPLGLLLATSFVPAFADTGRPTDYVPPVHTVAIDRHADDAFARYQQVVGGGRRATVTAAEDAKDVASVDAYARYLAVVDGPHREYVADSQSRQATPTLVQAGPGRRSAKSGEAAAADD
jgi:hypothetical protein